MPWFDQLRSCGLVAFLHPVWSVSASVAEILTCLWLMCTRVLYFLNFRKFLILHRRKNSKPPSALYDNCGEVTYSPQWDVLRFSITRQVKGIKGYLQGYKYTLTSWWLHHPGSFCLIIYTNSLKHIFSSCLPISLVGTELWLKNQLSVGMFSYIRTWILNCFINSSSSCHLTEQYNSSVLALLSFIVSFDKKKDSISVLLY